MWFSACWKLAEVNSLMTILIDLVLVMAHCGAAVA